MSLFYLLNICNILGVSYDSNFGGALSDCDRMEYLLKQIYIFLGGSEDA
ncbi:hypothetical protein [Sulfurimonas sp. NW9]